MKKMNLPNILLLILLIGVSPLSAQEEQEMDEMWGNQENIKTDSNSSKTALFDDGNYSMFIHWGIYSNIANKWKGKTYYGISEWIKNPRRADIPVEEYMAEAKLFDPVNFDAKAIVKLAKDAGMKYIVITSKHHDGFAMYDSKVNDFNIVDASPFGRDPMKELAKACKEEGIGFGFYYSHNQDWTFPGGNGGPKTTAAGKEVDFDYYFKEKCLPQVEEITTQYGDIAMVWFDTPGNMEKKYVEELVDVVYKNQPNAMISGRAGHGLGDYKSLGDMNIPTKNIAGLWETVDVTNDSWGYAWYDQNWKSSKEILMRTLSTVARGGTYMLNVGPKPDGSIPVEAQHALKTSGDWIDRYPQAIYKAGPSPWGRKLPWGDVTVTRNKLNLLIYDWPLDGELFLPGLTNDITVANLLINGQKQEVGTNKVDNWTKIMLPARRPEKLISVVEITIEGPLKVDQYLSVDPVYETVLPMDFAKAKNCKIDHIKWMEKFGEWKHITQAQDWTLASEVSFEVEVMKAGNYQVDLNYAGSGRMVWRVATDEKNRVQNEQNSSAIYQFHQMGLLKFEKPGKHTITISFIEGEMETTSLKAVRLTPWN